MAKKNKVLKKMFSSIGKAYIKGEVIITWNDPDPIKYNDYTVQKRWDITKETVMIQYGGKKDKYLSEAEVFISEISITNKKN